MYYRIGTSWTDTTRKRMRGFAIILALFITMAFMLVMADMMKTLASIEDYNRSSEAQQQAQLNAQMGLELGLLIYNHPEAVNIDKLLQSNGTYKVETKGGGEIVVKLSDSIVSAGKVCPPDNNNCLGAKDPAAVFVYPFPGTGKVGGARCDPNKISGIKDENWYRDMWYFYTNGSDYPTGSSLIDAVKDPTKASSDQQVQNKIKDFASLTDKINVLDHPCLWNYVHEGSTEEIMLYRKDVANGKSVIIGPEHLKSLNLTVKLPCDPSKSKQGQICTDDQRYTLDVPPEEVLGGMGIKNKKNPGPELASLPAVLWYMVSNCEQGGKPLICSMIGAYYEDPGSEKPIELKKEEQSMITYGDPGNFFNPSLANPSNHGIWSADLLNGARKGTDQKSDTTIIKDFLKTTYKHFNPTLNLSIANPLFLKDTAGPQYTNQIQYQLTYTVDGTKGTSIPMVINPVVVSTSRYKGYTITLETSLARQTGTYGYSFVGR